VHLVLTEIAAAVVVCSLFVEIVLSCVSFTAAELSKVTSYRDMESAKLKNRVATTMNQTR